MVGILEDADQVRVEIAQHRVKTARIGKSADREHPASCKAEWDFVPCSIVDSEERVRPNRGAENRARAEHGFFRRTQRRRLVAKIHHHDRVGAAQRADRLAHRAGRKHPAIAESVLVAHQQEIDVAMQPLVLKSIVQNDRIDRPELTQQFDGVDAAPCNRDRAGERLREHRGLVAGLFR